MYTLRNDLRCIRIKRVDDRINLSSSLPENIKRKLNLNKIEYKITKSQNQTLNTQTANQTSNPTYYYQFIINPSRHEPPQPAVWGADADDAGWDEYADGNGRDEHTVWHGWHEHTHGYEYSDGDEYAHGHAHADGDADADG
jgi:hypothetical protein